MNEKPPSHSHIRAVLFDIDQTLLDLFEFHEASYAETFQTIFGIKGQLTDISFSGKTSLNIFREVGALHGLTPAKIEPHLEAACNYVAEITRLKLNRLGPGIERYILPGVRQILAELQIRGLILGILSGNPPELGKIVLAVSGLDRFFSLYTFGTEANHRGELARLSLEKLCARFDSQITPQQILIIGDSIADIEAAQAIGAKSLAVATGFHTRAELAVQQPTALFNTLANTQKIIATFFDI